MQQTPLFQSFKKRVFSPSAIKKKEEKCFSNGVTLKMIYIKKTLKNPIALAFSLKHLLHTFNPYFLMSPQRAPQTRLKDEINIEK